MDGFTGFERPLFVGSAVETSHTPSSIGILSSMTIGRDCWMIKFEIRNPRPKRGRLINIHRITAARADIFDYPVTVVKKKKKKNSLEETKIN